MKRLILVIVAVLFAASCSEWNDDRGKGDAPVDQRPDQTVNVYPNGDGYPNIAWFCIGGNGVYTTTREAPPVIIPDDPECYDEPN